MDKFWTEHVYLLYISNIGGFVIAWYFIRKWFNANIDILKELKDSVSDLYRKYNDIEHRLSTLEGEHGAYIKSAQVHK